jgi:hypothetical protein
MVWLNENTGTAGERNAQIMVHSNLLPSLRLSREAKITVSKSEKALRRRPFHLHHKLRVFLFLMTRKKLQRKDFSV